MRALARSSDAFFLTFVPPHRITASASSHMPPSKKKTPVKSKKSAAQAEKEKAKSFIVKTKIPKDPKAPKGALTAFMIYCIEMRPKLSASISFGESGKQLGEQWRSLKPAQKAKYEKKAQADKERYQSEMAKYKPSAKMAKEIADAKAKAPKLKAVCQGTILLCLAPA